MSLKSVTGRIDNVITLIVLALCLGMWIAFGFPHPTEVAMVAAGVLLLYGALWWLDRRPKG